MAEYLIAFNDEWVPGHSLDELREKSRRSRAVLERMRSAGVFVYTNGGIDASTCIGHAVSRDDTAICSDGPYRETAEHLGGFCVIDVPDDAAARRWAGELAVALEWPQEIHRFPGTAADPHVNR